MTYPCGKCKINVISVVILNGTIRHVTHANNVRRCCDNYKNCFDIKS